MKVLIKVTKEVLEKSKMCGLERGENYLPPPTNCAIAVAVRELFPQSSVGRDAIIIPTKDFLISKSIRILLPSKAQAFIVHFDTRLNPEERVAMSPISFEVDVPDAVIERIGINQAYKVLSESKTLEMVMEEA